MRTDNELDFPGLPTTYSANCTNGPTTRPFFSTSMVFAPGAVTVNVNDGIGLTNPNPKPNTLKDTVVVSLTASASMVTSVLGIVKNTPPAPATDTVILVAFAVPMFLITAVRPFPSVMESNVNTGANTGAVIALIQKFAVPSQDGFENEYDIRSVQAAPFK